MSPRVQIRTRLISVLLCALFVTSTGCATVAGKLFLPREGIRPAEYNVKANHVVTTMRDGVELISHVYRPKGLEKTPTILLRIPMTETFKNRLRANVMGDFWASRGYTVVLQHTRGRRPSGGDYYPLRPHREDGIDTLRWLEAQPWYDGRLGMWGGSSFGYAQWSIADQTDPGPSAYMIQIASARFYDALYAGNAFALESALYWTYRTHRDWNRKPSTEVLRRGAYGFPLLEADDRAMGDVPFFNDWARHVDRDAYWRNIDAQDHIEALRAPVHLMAGWFDYFCPPNSTTSQRFETRRIRRRPRAHGSSSVRGLTRAR
jgi:uncharacterized protein